MRVPSDSLVEQVPRPIFIFCAEHPFRFLSLRSASQGSIDEYLPELKGAILTLVRSYCIILSPIGTISHTRYHSMRPI